MTECKYFSGRSLPISFNHNNVFDDSHYCNMILITNGSADILLNGKKIHIKEKTLIYLNPDDNAEIISSLDLQAEAVSFSLEFININLTNRLINEKKYCLVAEKFGFPTFKLFNDRSDIYNGILPLEEQLFNRIKTIFKNIEVQITNQPTIKWSCTARFYLFTLIEITEYFCSQVIMNSELQDEFTEIINYIHINLCDDLRLETLSKQFLTNRTTLNNLFKEHLNETVNNYIIKKRIVLAKYSFAFTEMSIKDTSVNCGFNDIVYFVKLFKKRVGRTPSEYRHEMVDMRKQNQPLSDYYLKNYF